MRVLAVALLGILASLGSSYGVVYWRTRPPPPPKEAARVLEQRKTRVINVPVVMEGRVQGYVVAQFIYTADAAELKKQPSPPDAFILDEAFRLLYGDDKLDFRKLKKVDLARLTTELRARVVERMKSELVQEIMVQDFNYVSRDDIRR